MKEKKAVLHLQIDRTNKILLMSTEHSEPQTVVEKVPIQLLQTTRDHDDTTWTFNPEFLRKLVAGLALGFLQRGMLLWDLTGH